MSASTPVSRTWWAFALFGVLAIGFGLFALARPQSTVWVLLMAFGVLALGDGLASLLSVFRKEVMLPNWLLLLYAAASIGFGLLTLLNREMVANVLVWLLALWLVFAGIARIVFAVQLRKLIHGHWLLLLSGVLAVLLGVLFLARPDLGVAGLALWIAIGALVYGALQLAVAFYLRRRAARLA